MTPHPAPPSQWIDLDEPVHFVDYGGPADGPLILCVHGLGGSHVNWAALAPHLTETARVVAVDLPGFGLTRPGARSASVQANQQALHRFLTEVVQGPAILVGNSMGGLISIMEASAHPRAVAGLVLIDPAILVGNSMGGLISIMEASAHPSGVAGLVLIDPALPMTVRGRPDPLVTAMFATYAVPRLGRRAVAARARLGPQAGVMDTLRLCCVDPSRVPEDVVEQHVAVATSRADHPEAPDAMIEAARSLMMVLARRRRFAAMLNGLAMPVLLLHGEKDRLVPLASARAVAETHPAWRFEVAPDIGHIPQLEAPVWTAGHILDWLATSRLAGVREREA